MRILSIGQYFIHPDVTYDSYRSSLSFLDFDTVIINPSEVFEEYEEGNPEEYQGCRNLSDNESPKLIEDINRRNSEIQELLKLGRTIIVMLPPPKKCFYNAELSSPNAGHTSRSIRNIQDLELSKTIPVDNLNLILADGENIEFKGDPIFKPFFGTIKTILSYSSYMSNPKGKPFLFIRGTDKAIASWIPTESGILLLLPHLNFNFFTTNKKMEEYSLKFVHSLDELLTSLKKTIGEYPQPDWANKYLLPNEKKMIKDLTIAEKNLQKALRERDLIKTKLAEFEPYKLLLYGQSTPLQKQVAHVLKEIGFKVQEGTGNRVDLIIQYNNTDAVVDVKGTIKSAAERNSRQLEQWISEYCVENEASDCKGILIINAFSDLPLDERSSRQEFPDSMVKISSDRQHCLMTTTQLLGLHFAIMKQPKDRDKYLSELINTIGIYPHFKDYSKFIEK